MEALVLGCVLAAALALIWWVPRRRLQQALARPLSAAQLAVLERNLVQYQGMSPAQRAQLGRLVQQFLYEKKFVGCAGLDVTDEMRVTIAAQACLLLLGTAGPRLMQARAARIYPALETILLYPGAFLVPKTEVDEAGVVTQTRQDLLGESWGDGRVILSWEHVRRAAAENDQAHEDDPGHEDDLALAAPGQNVVLHEFAHQLDSESGDHNGAPYLGSNESYRSWSEVLARDFAGLRADAMFGHQGVLDHYGATSPAEFFAVATESFFEQPHQLAERHPALFAEFEQYYRIDPRAWFAPPPEPVLEPLAQGAVYGQWQ